MTSEDVRALLAAQARSVADGKSPDASVSVYASWLNGVAHALEASAASSPSGPVIVSWEPKWKPPLVRAACPSCGRVAERRSSAWSANVGGWLDARFVCDQDGGDERECWRVFDLRIPLPASAVSSPPTITAGHPVKVSTVPRCVCGLPVVLRPTDDPERDVWVHDTRFTTPMSGEYVSGPQGQPIRESRATSGSTAALHPGGETNG